MASEGPRFGGAFYVSGSLNAACNAARQRGRFPGVGVATREQL